MPDNDILYFLLALSFVFLLKIIFISALWLNYRNSGNSYLAIACGAGVLESLRHIPDFLFLSTYLDTTLINLFSALFQFLASLVLLYALARKRAQPRHNTNWTVGILSISALLIPGIYLGESFTGLLLKYYLLALPILATTSLILWNTWQISQQWQPSRILLVVSSILLLAIRGWIPYLDVGDLYYLAYYIELLMFPIMLGALDLSEVENAHQRVRSLLADQSQSRKDLQFILDNSLDVILVTDEAGLLQSWSKTAKQSFGYTYDQVIGKMHIDELFIGFLPHSKTNEASEFQGTMERLDGSTFLVNVRTRTIKRRRNEIFAIYVLQDLSEQEKIIKKQAELDRQLDRAKKLESLGTLAGGIAHDFNNIMTGIFGNISFAKKNLDPDHRVMEFLERAQSSISRATALSEQLLTFSKGGIPTTDVVDIRKALEEAIDFDLSEGLVSYNIGQAGDLSPVAGNKNQLQRIFSNLITNAIQAMPQGGNLYFSLSNAEVSESEISPLAPGRYVKIIVKDDGVGIKPKALDNIFDPYFTTKEIGHGLGLTTVYSIVENHNGHIDVTSAVGKGTTFTIYLPASSRASLPEASVKDKTIARESFYGRALLLDDEKMICKIASQMLTDLGFEVDTATNGESALELYGLSIANKNPYKLVILDLTIPEGIGGKEVAKAILDIDHKAVLIVSSGYADDQVMSNYTEHGFRAAMAKPYTIDGLERTLTSVLGTEEVK